MEIEHYKINVCTYINISVFSPSRKYFVIITISLFKKIFLGSQLRPKLISENSSQIYNNAQNIGEVFLVGQC